MASTSITQKPPVAAESIAHWWLNVESEFRLWMDIHKASWIYKRLRGYVNKLTHEEHLRFQTDETVARNLDLVANLTLDVVTSDEMRRRLTLHQAAGDELDADAQPDEEAPAAPAPAALNVAQGPNLNNLANVKIPAGNYTFRQQQMLAYAAVRTIVSKLDPDMLFYIRMTDPDCGTHAVELMYRTLAPRTDVMADIIDDQYERLFRSFTKEDPLDRFFTAALRMQHIRDYTNDRVCSPHDVIDRLIIRIAHEHTVESTLYQSVRRFKGADVAMDDDRFKDFIEVLRTYTLQNIHLFKERAPGKGYFEAFKRAVSPKAAGSDFNSSGHLHKALATIDGNTGCTWCATILGRVLTNHTYDTCKNRHKPELLVRLF